MGKVRVTLVKTRAYGRDNFYPGCHDSELIMSFMKNRVAFDTEEVDTMQKTGWTVKIIEEPTRSKK